VNSRWRKALKAEAAAWKVNPSPQKLTGGIRRHSLEYIRNYTSLSEKELENMRMLEIGGRAVEKAFDSVSIPPKLVLDPLFPFARVIGQRDKSCHRLRGVGEYIPLPDKSIDLCWCANVIDHTCSPRLVLKEVRRVLDDHGILVISCDIFPAWSKPLFSLFNVLDTPHPHHFTLASFRTLLRREFEIQREFEVNSVSRLSLTQNLKNNIAAVIGVRYVFSRCTLIKR